MYGLIGRKLGHSFSANYFNNKFRKEGINESYHLFQLSSIDEFPDLIERNTDLKGLNVTIPYKQEVMPFLSHISDEAKDIGAVNVIKISRNNGQPFLEGYNSDCFGFENSLKPLLTPLIKNALILGTGGASKAVVYVLKKLGIHSTFVSRNPAANQLSYDDLTTDIIAENKLIVNTTPLGMYPDIESYPPIPYHCLTSDHLCYDLVYNPEKTEFLKKAEAAGAKIKNGLEMLELQAIGSWQIWNH